MLIRALDLVFSLLALVVLSPILLLVALWNLMTGEHQILYRQLRIGIEGKPFEIIKFATMLYDSPNMAGGGFVEANDTRLLPLGRYKKNKDNELPSL